jgi:hypothetical protein
MLSRMRDAIGGTVKAPPTPTKKPSMATARSAREAAIVGQPGGIIGRQSVASNLWDEQPPCNGEEFM